MVMGMGHRRRRIKMTKDANLKKIVRDRMSTAQERYTSAKQAITESPIYTITIISFDEDREKGEIVSRLLTNELTAITNEKYGLRDYVDSIVGWTSIRSNESPEDYFVKGAGVVPRERYASAGRKILVEYLHGISLEETISYVLPNTDVVILHESLNYKAPLGEPGLRLPQLISKLPEPSQKEINKFMNIVSEWWEGGLVDIITPSPARLVMYIPRDSKYIDEVQHNQLENLSDEDEKATQKVRFLAASEELKIIYRRSGERLLEGWLKRS